MTPHEPRSRLRQPKTSRIPQRTLEAAREVVRHCFESASVSEAARVRPALAAMSTGVVGPVQPNTR
jgi:hypothetical protein